MGVITIVGVIIVVVAAAAVVVAAAAVVVVGCCNGLECSEQCRSLCGLLVLVVMHDRRSGDRARASPRASPQPTPS